MKGLLEQKVGSASTSDNQELFHLATAAVVAAEKLEKQKDSVAIKRALHLLSFVEVSLRDLEFSLDEINNALWLIVKLTHSNSYYDSYLDSLLIISEKYPLKDLNWLAAPEKEKTALVMLAESLLKAVIAKKDKSVASLTTLLQKIVKEVPFDQLGLDKVLESSAISPSTKDFLLIVVEYQTSDILNY